MPARKAKRKSATASNGSKMAPKKSGVSGVRRVAGKKGTAKQAASPRLVRARLNKKAGKKAAGTTPAPKVMVVNMIPRSLSSEVNQDSEPTLAVNPANTDQIVGTAFTPN